MAVLVIRVQDVNEVVTHLENMGLDFLCEKHGKGPVHFACQRGDDVLEIYPIRKGIDSEEVYFVPEDGIR